MRLLSLLIALFIISGLVIYNKNSLFPGKPGSSQTVKEQAHQIIDSTNNSALEMQKRMEQEQQGLKQSSE